ncbi:hypothetical protein [Pseudomonas sp. Fl4BN1]|uniref:hypothetical protein n=1 Tax=Pseudomonas sp. Fl4BN1 TaxID=2697651 RepID=UPI001378DEB0|nr:hypothetical protein [Pseudomonas sp. Fl4BN1]NBF09768.1 hypothetical protein [Pseudomonas sp. Fl4BN1]
MTQVGNPARLIAHIEISYPNAEKTFPDTIGTAKFTFPDRLICNVFANGTVNFQGRNSPVKAEIEAQIEIINRA